MALVSASKPLRKNGTPLKPSNGGLSHLQFFQIGSASDAYMNQSACEFQRIAPLLLLFHNTQSFQKLSISGQVSTDEWYGRPIRRSGEEGVNLCRDIRFNSLMYIKRRIRKTCRPKGAMSERRCFITVMWRNRKMRIIFSRHIMMIVLMSPKSAAQPPWTLRQKMTCMVAV